MWESEEVYIRFSKEGKMRGLMNPVEMKELLSLFAQVVSYTYKGAEAAIIASIMLYCCTQIIFAILTQIMVLELHVHLKPANVSAIDLRLHPTYIINTLALLTLHIIRHFKIEYF